MGVLNNYFFDFPDLFLASIFNFIGEKKKNLNWLKCQYFIVFKVLEVRKRSWCGKCGIGESVGLIPSRYFAFWLVKFLIPVSPVLLSGVFSLFCGGNCNNNRLILLLFQITHICYSEIINTSLSQNGLLTFLR